MAKGYFLIVLRFFIIASLVLSTIAQTTYPWSFATSKHMTVCSDKECHDRAKIVAESIDKKVDPCDDFYQYVCGKWATKNPIPADKFEWTVEDKLDIHAIKEMSSILQYGPDFEEPDVNQAKTIYHICNNLPAMSPMDAKYLNSFVKHAGPWPMFNPEDKLKVSWIDIHNYYLRLTGDAGLFTINVHHDRKTGESLLHLNQAAPPFGLIQRFDQWSIDENIKHQYFLLILARMVADKNSKANDKEVIQDIIDVLAFRQKLEKNIHSSTIEFSPMIIKHFHNWYEIKVTSQKAGTKIPWLYMFQDFLKNTGLKVNEDTKIVIENKDTFSYLPRIFSNTPKHVIANHLHLYFIEKHILLNEDLNDVLSNLLISNGKIIGNTVSRLDRSIICVLKHPMKDTLGKLYVKQHFDEDIKKSVLHYANKMRSMIKTQIVNSEWLNSETKDMLVTKLIDIDLNLGYRNRSDEEDIDPKNIRMTPYRAISFYTPKENGIFISAGYFRSPVYGYNLPSAVNYGTIATFIAYELYHAFNVYHAHTEPTITNGECKYCLSKDMLKILHKKSYCFEYMYNDLVEKDLEKIKPTPKYCYSNLEILQLPGMLRGCVRVKKPNRSKTNGAQTLFENIADVMGIRTAMDAFKKILWESQGKCRILPHLKDLTCEKLFFISYAATYCTATPAWRLLKHMQLGTHSTSRFRVNVPLANMEEFKTAFGCSSRSRMVSKDKCYLW